MTIDKLIFGAFLGITLAIGIYYGRNVKTIRDYALGTHSFSTLMIAGTITATWTTGTGFNVYLDNFFHHGLIWFLYSIATVLALWFLGSMALRMGEFTGSLSIAEVLGKVYGPYARFLGALSSILLCIIYLGGQFRAGAEVLVTLFGSQSATWLLYAVVLVITLYAVLGGLNSVVVTDGFQFILMALFMPLLLFTVYRAIPSDVNIYEKLQQMPQLSLSSFFGNAQTLQDKAWKLSHFSFLFCVFLIIGFAPQMFQRTLLTKQGYKTRKAFFLSGLFWAYIIGAIILLSLLLLAANPLLATTGKKKLVQFVITEYTGPGLRGLMAVGLFCIMMSTADSFLNTSATIFVNDILTPLGVKQKSLKSAHLFSLLSSCMAIYFAKADIKFIEFSTYSWAYYFPIVVVPIILALLGFRTSQRIALTGMAAGASMFTILYHFIYSKDERSSDFVFIVIGIAMIANAVVMLLAHYLLGEPGGWVGIKVKAPLVAERQASERRWQNFKNKLARFNFLAYLSKQCPKHAGTYSLLGMYVMGPVFFSFFLLKESVALDHSLFYWAAYPMLALNALLAVYPIWFASWRSTRFIVYFFPLSVCFSLFVVPSILWITTGYHVIYLVLLGMNLLIALIQWSLLFAGPLACLSYLTAGLLWQGIGPKALHAEVTASANTMVAYSCLLFGCYLMALMRSNRTKQRIASYYYQLVREHDTTSKTLRKLRTTPERFVEQLRDKTTGLETGVDMGKALQRTLQAEKASAKVKQAAKQLTRHIQDSSRYLNKLFTLVEQGGLLRNKNIELNTFTHKLLNAIARDPSLHTKLIIANQSKAATVNWDSEKIQDLLLKGHKRLQKAHPDQDYFFLHLQDTHLAYPNYPKGLPAVALTLTIEEAAPQLETTYLPPDKVLTIATTPYQRQAQQCVSIHYGFFGAQNAPCSYLFVLPKNLKAIRPESISDSPATSFSPAMLRKAKVMEAEFWINIGNKSYDIPSVEKAVAFMKDAHAHQQRKSGEPYYTHPLTVAQYVSQHNNKQDVLIAALLHDTIEDTDVTPEALKLHFSPRVSELVNHLSHIEHTFKKYKLSDDQTHSKLENAIHDKEAVLIKLCDRLHNLYTLGAMPKHKQIAKAKETLKVYIPMGNKVGYTKLAQELNRLCQAVVK